jgi:hypothetical protein
MSLLMYVLLFCVVLLYSRFNWTVLLLTIFFLSPIYNLIFILLREFI